VASFFGTQCIYSYRSHVVQAVMLKCGFEETPYPPYSPDLAGWHQVIKLTTCFLIQRNISKDRYFRAITNSSKRPKTIVKRTVKEFLPREVRVARYCQDKLFVRPCICLSVTLRYRDHIGWNHENNFTAD